VQCPTCHSDCPPEFDFCPRCATPLRVTCPKCGFRAPGDFQFCPKCATALAPSAVATERDTPGMLPQAIRRLMPKEYAERLLATRGQPHDERRTVTILFSDVKGSTAMAERLDPEDFKEIMEGAFEFLIAPIYRYEGTLTQLMGDAILAFFGAPIAHEDDPERACRAALEITAGAAEYAEKLERERGIQGFNVRVGINTGLVVVGEVGSDLRVAYTAIGHAINLAARMETAAEPGTVLITEATYKLIAPLFETEALGPLQVKGKAEPVDVYRVMAVKPVAGKVRGIAGLESPLVGRQAEFAALQEALERLRAGMGGIVTIVGEAGIGKSRLVAEVRKEASAVVGAIHESPLRVPLQSPPPQWVEGRCLSYGTSIAYLLWLDILRGLLGETSQQQTTIAGNAPRQRLQEMCQHRCSFVYPYLAHLLALPVTAAEQTAIESLDGEKLKAATFRAVGTLLRCAAGDRPLVVICEDLHWADPTSMELLERVLPLTHSVAVLFICALRPDKRHGSWLMRERVARQYPDHHVSLWLQPFSGLEGQRLLDNLMGPKGLPEELTERTLTQAEGNPFYLEEIIRSLLGSGALVQDGETGQWQVSRHMDDIEIPGTLHGVLMARIDRLPEDAKRVLQTASVIGRIFTYHVLGAVAEEEATLDKHLMTLQQEEMIHERAHMTELEYVFKHELTRKAAYGSLLKKERRAIHRRVAEALERLFPARIEEHLALLAHHWEQSGDPHKALGYLLRAGDKARLAYAHQEAIDYYQRAQTILQKIGSGADKQWLVSEEGLGDVRGVLGEHDQALLHYEQARSLVAALPEPSPRLAALCRKTAMLYERKGEYSTAFQWLEQGLSVLEGQSTLEMSRLRLAGAGVYSRQGQHHQALEWCKIGLELARQHNDPAELAHGTYLLGTIHGHLGHSAEEIAYARKSLDLYTQMGDVLGQANALNNLGIACKESGDWDAAIGYFQDGLDLEEQLGDVHGVAKVTNNLGNVLLWQGQLDAAARAYQQSLDIWQAIGFPIGMALSWSNLGKVCSERGQWGQALDYLERSRQCFQEIQSRHFLPEVYRRLATARLGLGQLDEARQAAEHSVALATELDMELEKGISLRTMGQVHHALQHWKEAEEVLISSLCILQKQNSRYRMGETLYHLGCLYRVMSGKGDTAGLSRATSAWERARAIFEELGAERDLARVREVVT
jgi:class 3 adenylate cyclase/tetratricopeptide (TPR) repeat protein